MTVSIILLPLSLNKRKMERHIMGFRDQVVLHSPTQFYSKWITKFVQNLAHQPQNIYKIGHHIFQFPYFKRIPDHKKA